MPTEWNIQFDWNRDGDYTDAHDDQTARVISAKWTLGMIEPHQLTAGDMMLNLILSNSDGHLSPENATSPLYGLVKPHVPVRVVAHDGITERVMWTGWIDQLKPQVGKFSERRMEILASGPLPFYTATETRLGLQENQRTDQIIAQLIAEVVYPPALAGAFILGVAGQSSLGESTRLVDPTGGRVLDEGALTLAYAVDNWVREGGYTDAPQTGYDVMRGIREITAAERGKFFFNREGQAVFWNRGHQHRQEGTPITLNDTM